MEMDTNVNNQIHIDTGIHMNIDIDFKICIIKFI